ncbi:MAG TPA: hypothetical protein VFA07_07925 [Chthonomonadaceae bacterium]|nr:hypothetical protein [Chthonomonadaceae bacterium]
MKRIKTTFHSLRTVALGLSLAAVLGAGVLAAPGVSSSSRQATSLHATVHPVQIAHGGGDGQETHGGGGGKGGHRHSSYLA